MGAGIRVTQEPVYSSWGWGVSTSLNYDQDLSKYSCWVRELFIPVLVSVAGVISITVSLRVGMP